MIRPPPRSTLFPYTTPSDLVDATPQLVKQAQQLMTQPCRHLFRGNLAVTLLEFFEALCSHFYDIALQRGEALCQGDRKSTRLNSSHTVISYAVFCLKKKNTPTLHQST